MRDRKRLLIADGDIGFTSKCASALQNDFSVVGIAKDGEEATLKIRQCRPEVVILELLLAKRDGCRIISEFTSNAFSPVFVVVTGACNMEMIAQASICGASYCMQKPVDFEFLAETVLRLTNKSKKAGTKPPDDLELQVTEMIHRIGIPANIKGYSYLRTAIMEAVCDPQTVTSVTKTLYPSVAKTYKTTVPCVERDMRKAIESAWDRGSMSTLSSIFGYTVKATRGRPTNSEFIALIADNLRLKNKK